MGVLRCFNLAAHCCRFQHVLALKSIWHETFDYDALNRLTGSQRNGAQNLTLTYNAIGNILTKSDVGSYTYHSTKRRAVIQAGSTVYGYDANGNMTSRADNAISYTSYNLPSLMNQGSNSSAVSYGAFRNRFKQVTAGAEPTTTIYVAGILERVTRPGGVTEFRHQIHGPTGTVAIYTRRSSGTADTYYLHRDHLGSPELITNAAGTQIVKLSFGAFGERRGANWTGTPSTSDWTAIGNTTRDGFTDHEHLDAVGLVHMNGRVYDPRIGRFLSKDPIVHVGLSQSPNSYSYVWNNPLRWRDPTGFDPTPPVFDDIDIRGRRIDDWGWDECDWGGPFIAGCTWDLYRSRMFGERYFYEEDWGGGGAAEEPPAEETPEPEKEAEPEQPSRQCTGPTPDFAATGRFGAFIKFMPRVGGFAFGFDLNLFRLNFPAGGPDYIDQGFAIGIRAQGRPLFLGFERRSDNGGRSFSDYAWYGRLGDVLSVQSESLVLGLDVGAGLGGSVELSDPLLMLSGDTPCR